MLDHDPKRFIKRKLLNNHQIKTCKAKNSFLAGKIKCGHCGYAMAIRISQRKKSEDVKYFVDTGRTDYKVCNEKVSALRVNEFENEIVKCIKNKLESLNIQHKSDDNIANAKIRSLMFEKEKIDEEIKNLVSNLSTTSNKITMSYIEERITELDRSKHEIESVIQIERSKKLPNQEQLQDVISKWDILSFDDKRAVVELLIQKIVVYKDHIEIMWHV